MVTKFTTVDRIFAKFQRDYGINVPEVDLIEWAGEAMEAIGATRHYQENVAFIEVKNYTCELPNFLFSINQVALDTKWTEDDKTTTGICPAEIIMSKKETETEDDLTPDADYPIYLDCDMMPINDYELAYYRPFFDLMWQYPQWKGSLIHQRFQALVPSSNNFFNFMVCENDVCPNDFGTNSAGEYKIIDGTHLRFNFEKGMVAISYLKYRVDEKTGYPLIPDHEIYTTAIANYCIMKYTKREFYQGREGSAQRMDKADSDWQWYVKRARTHAKMPTADEYEQLLRQRHRMISGTDDFRTFFGKLNKQESFGTNHQHNRRIIM